MARWGLIQLPTVQPLAVINFLQRTGQHRGPARPGGQRFPPTQAPRGPGRRQWPQSVEARAASSPGLGCRPCRCGFGSPGPHAQAPSCSSVMGPGCTQVLGRHQEMLGVPWSLEPPSPSTCFWCLGWRLAVGTCGRPFHPVPSGVLGSLCQPHGDFLQTGFAGGYRMTPSLPQHTGTSSQKELGRQPHPRPEPQSCCDWGSLVRTLLCCLLWARPPAQGHLQGMWFQTLAEWSLVSTSQFPYL